MADTRNKHHETFELSGEKELRRALKQKEPTFAEVEQCLTKFRTACQGTIFQHLRSLEGQGLKNNGGGPNEQREDGPPSPSAPEIENRLWDVHLKINARFRKILSNIRDDEARGNKRPVEKRKLLKRYSRFVSSSQRFYDGYIYLLVEKYNTGDNQTPELNEVARQKKFIPDPASSSTPAGTISDTLQRNVLDSCHSSLIKLGDLSRYYQTELVDEKKREWKRAMENYSLASFVDPNSGMSHNQIAVIALADGDHLQVVYNLYRALQAKEPHPTAKGNLDIEFKKILSCYKKEEPLSRDENKPLISSFCYLHAQCYKGIDFPEHEELENEILRQLAVDLKENSLSPSLLQTICLINIAAETHARNQAAEQETSGSNGQLCFRRLNVKMFFTLVQVLLAELEYSTGKAKLTSVAHCVLPVLRQYSSWLLVNSQSLVSVSGTRETPLFVQIKEFWKSYANTLTLLTSSFDVPGLPELEYLLPEDMDTLGFRPLSNDATTRRYRDNEGKEKSRVLTSSRHADTEMLFRIRELVVDGLDLVVHERIPVVMVDDEDNEAKLFVYKEEGLPQLSSPRAHGHTLSSTSIDRNEIQMKTPKPNPSLLEDGASASASVSVSAAMNRMVDNLVESEPADSIPGDDNIPWGNSNAYLRCNTQNEPVHGNGLGIANAPHSYSPGPQLPSILNTPFAPQPGDAMSPGSRPSTAVPCEASNLPSAENDGLLNQPFSLSQSPFYNQFLFQQGRYTQSSLDDPSSSFSPMHTPRLGHGHNEYIGQPPLVAQRSQYTSGITPHTFPRRFSSMSSQFSGTPHSSDISGTRHVGVIGRQTPPSGQGG